MQAQEKGDVEAAKDIARNKEVLLLLSTIRV